MNNVAPWYKEWWWQAGVVFVVGLINHFADLNVDPQFILALFLPILAAIFANAWVAKEEVALRREEIKLARVIKEKEH